MTRAILLFPLLALGGCISLLPEPAPPPRIFALEAADVAHAQQAPLNAAIAVASPGGDRSILGVDLVWRTGDEVAFVAQTQWSGRAETSLQAMLLETLSRQGRFAAVTRAGEGRANYELRWDVLHFDVQEEGMQARFSADVRILALPGRRILAQRTIMADAPVADRSASVAAQALARAAREGSARIGEFAAETAAEAEGSAAVN
ncbi:MAG: ABC-type transport auxiliary lipoprotein family protein [Hyphomonadaceae bacterium]